MYRKKMNRQHIIRNSAYSHFSYKFSTFRAYKVCYEDFLNNELDEIGNIAGSNGYRKSSINKLLNYYRNENSKREIHILIEDYNKGGAY